MTAVPQRKPWFPLSMSQLEQFDIGYVDTCVLNFYLVNDSLLDGCVASGPYQVFSKCLLSRKIGDVCLVALLTLQMRGLKRRFSLTSGECVA